METITINKLLVNTPIELNELTKHAIQLYDIFDQALIRFIESHDIWNEEASLKSSSYSAKGRCLKKYLDPSKHQLVNKWVDNARYGRYGKEDPNKLEQFIKFTKALSEELNLNEEAFELRIPIANSVINSATVESRKGFKTISLSHTDLLVQKTDLLVLTTTHMEKPSGLFFDRLRDQCDFTIPELRAFYSINNEVFTALLPGNEKTGFKNLLILNMPKREKGNSPKEMLAWMNTLLLSSWAILEIQEKPLKLISMPVLRAQQMNNKEEYKELADLLLKTSAKWLKKSEVTTEVTMGIYYKDELDEWNAAMNSALGRSSVNKDNLINEICKDLNGIIDRHMGSVLQDALKPLKSYLHQSDEIGIESIFIQGRKLVELMVSDLAKKKNLKIGGELMSNIEKLREIKMAPWLLSYMHTLRVFGNEGVHVRLDGKTYSPNTLSKSDLINGLTAIRALMLYWEESLSIDNESQKGELPKGN